MNMIKQAEKLLSATKAVCPVRTGDLRNSGHIIDNGDEVIMTYDKDYAIYVHERAEGRGYKWVEKTLNSMETQLVEEFANDVINNIFK